MFAVLSNNERNVKIILKAVSKSSFINQRDNIGNTALHFACLNGLIEIVRILHRAGADMQIKNNNQESPLDLAIDQKHEAIIDFFKSLQPNKVAVKKKKREEIKDSDFLSE